MILYIAEKPSLGRAIAHGLGNGIPKDGYILINHGERIVTWCFGHILRQFDPDDYDERYKVWKTEDLPIIPNPWKLKVSATAKKQFHIVKELIAKADYIVHAGDPDREGQLLVDEVLEFVENQKPVKRLLLNALDDKSVKEALNNLRDNQDFVGLKNSALARSRADWLIGMNLTRAYSQKARQAGYNHALSIGRVRTPTMALVVRREEEIAHFQPVTYYQAKVIWHHPNGDISTIWKTPSTHENRLLDKTIAATLLEKLQNKNAVGTIKRVEKQEKKVGQRLLYSLSSLQIEAGKKYGYKPQEVLDTMQELYEKKLTSYPRSDCEYLLENQYAEAKEVLLHLASLPIDGFAQLVKNADIKIRSRIWNDKKVSAHHAIIPTTKKADFSQLTEMQQRLYHMVALAYLAQFYPLHSYESIKLVIQYDQDEFVANGKNIFSVGWKALYQTEKEADDENEVNLPSVTEKDSTEYKSGHVVEEITRPPTRFTPATLIQAMKEIHKFVLEPARKKELKECSGIGTEATRAGIIEKLQTDGFLKLEKKYLVPADMSKMAMKVLPDEITYPDTTAIWEQHLDGIATGKMSLSDFLHKQEEQLRAWLHAAQAVTITPTDDVPLCPNCKKPLVRRKGKNGFFWGCTGYPECKTTLPDKKGVPDFTTGNKSSSYTGNTAECPICHGMMKQYKKGNDAYWYCSNKSCQSLSFSDHNDKPVIEKCPNCSKGYLRRFVSKKKMGSYFWACSERSCKRFYLDDNGLPRIDN